MQPVVEVPPRYEAVVAGGSSGGFDALKEILRGLPRDFPLPVIVVLHLHPRQDAAFCSRMFPGCPLPVSEAAEKEPVEAGHVYFAPPNYHLLIERDRTFALSVDAPVNYSRPSIDVLFESAAAVYGAALAAIILSGANQDGVQGLRGIRGQGGLVIAQDPATAQTDYMPRAAIAAATVDHVLPLPQIAPFLRRLVLPHS